MVRAPGAVSCEKGSGYQQAAHSGGHWPTRAPFRRPLVGLGGGGDRDRIARQRAVRWGLLSRDHT